MMQMGKVRLVFVLALALCAVALSSCGGSSTPKLVKICSGLTDTCHTAPVAKLNRLAKLAPFAHCRIPDVSDYQGYVDWARAKPYVCGGITKAGEGGGYGGGSHFLHNWTQMRSLGLWHSAYWYIRGSASCQQQASLIIGRLNYVGYAKDKNAGPFMLDMESPGANVNGLGNCIDGYILRAFHRHAEIYTSPGTWPGGGHGSLPLWQAEYGSFLHPFWNPVNLWQCTDGVHGCVSFVPGIGFDDVSQNLGVTGIVAPKPRPKPAPKCLRVRHPKTTQCRRVRYGYHKTQLDLAKVQLRQRQHHCSARRHPSYCGGWKHAAKVDTLKLAAFRRTYA